ncbi:rab9 effector protein with kelch motifs [Antennarius striatus]|uniref:rab9 effector protein with kelch motifs n=1 Tax=Antennarius striatus TaxID=241820 RepID=UPI0035B1D523
MTHAGPCLWTPLPQGPGSPSDRYKHACCSCDGHVYVLGGRASGCLGDLWRYSVVCNEWAELPCNGDAAPEELEEHSMVAHEGLLYVFGGMLDSAYSKWRHPLWVFDVAKEKWVNWQRKPRPHQTRVPANRKGHSAVIMGSAMLVYGGFVDMKGSSQEFWSLDLGTMTWSLLSGGQQGTGSPGPRHSHSAVAHLGCMYLFGGLKGLREQRDMWRWSSTTSSWTSIRTWAGPPRLVGHSAVAYKDSMLLFGGGESQNSPKNCLWRYDFSTQSWGQVAFLPGSTPPEKIYHCCTGLGPSYRSGSVRPPKLADGRTRPFKNKCFPAPLTFLGSEGAIELQTLGPARPPRDRTETCLTFENKAFRRQRDDELTDEDEDLICHLPDLLLVLGGRPSSAPGPISVWQMTLTDS